MKKVTLIISALALLLGLSQCNKQNEPLPNGEKQHIVLNASFDSNGSKIAQDGAGLKWAEGDELTVKQGSNILGSVTCTNPIEGIFEGDITSTTGNIIFTFGEENYMNQTGELNAAMHLTSGDVAYKTDGNYNATMTTENAVLKLDIHAFGTEVGNMVTISVGDEMVASVVGVTATSTAMYVAMPAASERTYTFSGNDKSAERKWTLVANVFYTNQGAEGPTGESILIMPETDVLSGLFSVSDTKQVYFSKGNLRAIKNGNDWSWGFYDNQYECNSLNSGSGRTATADDTEIDLFTWGYGEYSTDPITTHNCFETYFPNFKDWGAMIDDEDTWFTLSDNEWYYLLNLNPYENAKRAGRWKMFVTVCGKENCLVLAPDNWDLDAHPLQEEYSSTSTPMTWEAAQEAGLVCLPAAGQRFIDEVALVSECGSYWSSSPGYDVFFRSIYFYFKDKEEYHYVEAKPYPGTEPSGYGFAVRLVTMGEN